MRQVDREILLRDEEALSLKIERPEQAVLPFHALNEQFTRLEAEQRTKKERTRIGING